MLKSLRWKLALLYFSSALGIVVLLAAGTYAMLDRFFTQQVDLALQYKMASQFKLYGLSLPVELKNAERLWLAENPHTSPVIGQIQMVPTLMTTSEPSVIVIGRPLIGTSSDATDSDGDENEVTRTTGEPQKESEGTEEAPHQDDDSFDGRLSSIFIVPIPTPQGMIVGSQPATAPIDEDIDASVRAMSLGYDLRTVSLPDGTHARLLTYRTSGNDVPAVIQIGRLLDDQDRLLQLYLIGLLVLGFIASLMISILSWYLSGRSIKPAQKAWDQQQLFISNASHELRTPLTLMRANADYALKTGKPRVKVTALREVLGEVDYMSHMVDDLLLLSRLDTRRLKLDHTEISVDLLLQEIAQRVVITARDRDVRISTIGSGCKIVGDPDRTRQVILNLIDNALRFTTAGGVIELGAVQRAGMVDLYVRDNGSGIAPQLLEKLFDRFYQVPNSNLSGTRNNGLGLSIAKALVEAQGGKMRLESQVGQGTTVWISMPKK
jgi:two-component system sensor histidine kinase CiaH